MFFTSKSWAQDEEIVALMARIAENVSVALDSFDRAAERKKTEEQKERLTRMFAALSATNEAIMRAKSRAQLFEMVCEAAAKGGKFTSTSINLVNRDSEFLDIVAVAGPTAETTEDGENLDQFIAPRGARAQRDRFPFPAGLHQQRLSG